MDEQIKDLGDSRDHMGDVLRFRLVRTELRVTGEEDDGLKLQITDTRIDMAIWRLLHLEF